MGSVAAISTRLLKSIDDAALSPREWQRLLEAGDSDVVFLTRPWQQAWWKTFGRGQLLLIVAERDERPIALAPLFCDGGMIFFVGSGGSDYLDLIGDIGEADVLISLLETARDAAREFLGFRFYHVPDASRTGGLLQEVAGHLNLDCFDEGELPAPALDLNDNEQTAICAANKTSLVRHERYFARSGELRVQHFRHPARVLPHLPEFFAQHVARWDGTATPSMFRESNQRMFFEEVVRAAHDADWLRFTRIDWQDRPIAFHFGMCYRGAYLWYKPTFAIDLAKRSPGEVLLRQLLLVAAEEQAQVFDFGLGDEAFKHRFATRTPKVRTWGLYPREVAR